MASTVSIQILCSWYLEFLSTENKTCDVAKMLFVDGSIQQHEGLILVQMTNATLKPVI